MNHALMKTHRGTAGITLAAALALLVALIALSANPASAQIPGPATAQSPVPASGTGQPTGMSGLYGSLFQAASVDELLGHNYVSTKVKGRKMAGKRVRLRFFMHSTNPDRPEKPTLGVSAGCNSLGATFTARNGRLRWNGPVSGTAMGCPKGNHDRWISRLMKRGMNAELSGKRLVLTRGKIRIALRQVK